MGLAPRSLTAAGLGRRGKSPLLLGEAILDRRGSLTTYPLGQNEYSLIQVATLERAILPPGRANGTDVVYKREASRSRDRGPDFPGAKCRNRFRDCCAAGFGWPRPTCRRRAPRRGPHRRSAPGG